MDKLEQYLDQVCRNIAGPRSLRQHIRQELREHLLDGAAEHRKTGLSEEEALARALADFGGPEQVRSELEATHGHRVMGVVIDKAIEWKEKTMKAKWLWASWAYLALVAVIVLEILFLTFVVIFILPKFYKLMRDGMIDSVLLTEQGVSWIPDFLQGVSVVGGQYTTILLLLALAVWGLFEWRIRSDNKPLMRLAALGSAALGLLLVAVLTASTLIVTFCLAMPAHGRLARPYALQQITTIDSAVNGLEQTLAKKDWEAMQENVNRVSQAFKNLLGAAPAIPSLIPGNEPHKLEELRQNVGTANEAISEASQAIRKKDADQLKAVLEKFRVSYDLVLKTSSKAGS